jgi:hypothetical protein
MFCEPDAVEVAELCVLVPVFVVRIEPEPVSLVGVWEAFIPREMVGVVPAVTAQRSSQRQAQVLATAGRDQLQIFVADVESVTAVVIRQGIPLRRRAVSSP